MHIDEHILFLFITRALFPLHDQARYFYAGTKFKVVIDSHLVVAAVLVVVSAIQWCTRLCVNLARLQAQIPNFRILFNLLSLVIA